MHNKVKCSTYQKIYMNHPIRYKRKIANTVYVIDNIKIRCIPESVKPPELNTLFSKLLTEVLPDTLAEELITDHIHRLPKPKPLSAKLPRDTIVCIHFYHVKKKLLALTQKSDPLPACLSGLTMYVDFSLHILQQQINLATTTKPLCNKHIPYCWGYPFKLLVTCEWEIFTITTLEESLENTGYRHRKPQKIPLS